MSQIRQPAVAGQFYPGQKDALLRHIESFSDKKKVLPAKKKAIACMLPHAGYIYSGAVAYSVLSQIEIPDTLIILGPNHTGMGAPLSIMDEGQWRSPLGLIGINSALAKALLKQVPLLQADFLAHQYEHSIEVELPLVQYFKEEFSFVPIVIGSNDFKSYQHLGQGIASVMCQMHLEKQVLIVASSDMTHYEDAKTAKAKDTKAIQAIIELDEIKLWNTIKELDISMCGYAPAIAMISAAKALGAKSAEVIKYQTSGDVTGDNESVVGYAGIIVGAYS